MVAQMFSIAFIVMALWFTFKEGEIFGGIRKWKMPEKIKNPLYDCSICMVPYWGTIAYWLLYHNLYQYPFVVIGAMGINAAINRISND